MPRPNILIIYTDQQRWDAVGVNDLRSEIKTPNLDRMAREGVNFDHHFVQNPVCMPSRVSFLSGQYPSSLKITHMGVPVPHDLPTLSKLFGPLGYHTANIGKLHFLPHANRDHRTPHPGYGFDHCEISDEPGCYEDAYRAWVRRHYPDQLDHISVGLPPATAEWYDLMHVNDEVKHPIEGPRFDFKGAIPFPGRDEATHSAYVGTRVCEYIREHAAGEPFCCIAGFYSPHSPWVVPQRFLDMYDPSTFTLPEYPPDVDARRKGEMYSDDQLRSARQGYFAMVTEVDHYVGQILETLDDEGIADNTIVIFTSDHGEWLGEHLKYGKGYPGDDAVARTPLLIRWPAGIRSPGKTVTEIVEAVDVLPTLMELAGCQVAPHLQGRSMAGALLRDEPIEHKDALMEHTGWKTLRSERYRYLLKSDGEEQLYDLDNDPTQYHDVSKDTDHAAALADMRHRLSLKLLQVEKPIPRVWPY